MNLLWIRYLYKFEGAEVSSESETRISSSFILELVFLYFPGRCNGKHSCCLTLSCRLPPPKISKQFTPVEALSAHPIS